MVNMASAEGEPIPGATEVFQRHGSLLTFWRFTNRIIIIIIMVSGGRVWSWGKAPGQGVCGQSPPEAGGSWYCNI